MTEKAWYALSVQEVLEDLKTSSEIGITPEESASRLEKFGSNSLTPAKRDPAWKRFFAQFQNPLVIILLVSAGVSFLAKSPIDSIVILAVTIVNAIIGFVQEQKAQSALDALARLVKTECMVFRGSDLPQRMDAEGLVPGDIVLLSTGDRVPADLRLIEAKNLQINESALTGESLPTVKHTAILTGEVPLGCRSSMAFSSSLVTSGSGKGVVVATGDETQIGLINALMNRTEEIDTPLMRRLSEFSAKFGFWIVVVSIGIFIYGVIQRRIVKGLFLSEDLKEMFMAAVSAAVGAIPEGLPAVMTIVLAIGVKNMANRKAIIRKLPAVETLGSVTVICSDKTGTLTANEMTVQYLISDSKTFTVDGVGFNPEIGKIHGQGEVDPLTDPDLHVLLKAGILCNDSRLIFSEHGVLVEGDPTEGAMLTVGQKAKLDYLSLRKAFHQIDVLPFDSLRQIMVSLNSEPDGSNILWVKGSVEKITDHSDKKRNGEILYRPEVLSQAEELARRGMRVIAFAMAKTSDSNIPEILPPLTFIGLQAMIDPPRIEVRDSLALCKKAGIKVKMITGDHLITAMTIAKDLGISSPNIPGMFGPDISKQTYESLSEQIEETAVFARVAPEHKFKLVETLQKKGHLVAMTGDGVNDAPALKKADIGVAMGASGTEVAKEAADIILVDDNFATLVRAVEEGRNVYNNLVKSMVYILPTNTGQGLVILVAVLLGMPKLPITPVQILWVNLLTAFLSLPLAFETMEKGLMEQPPRPPDEPIISNRLLFRVIGVALLMTVVSFLIYWYETTGRNQSNEVAQSAVVATMVFVELFYLFPARGLWAPMPKTNPTLNPLLWPCLFATVALQLAFTYVPIFQKFLGGLPIEIESWLVIIAAGLVVIPMVEIMKRWTMPPMSQNS